jgi:predicted dehydrogenase
MEELSRRRFVTAASSTALSYSHILGANNRVHIGYIGVGNRGDQVHDAFLEWADQETVAVCDLRDDSMELAVKKSHANPRKYRDYRKLLEDRSVDAVVIATPDHWHALMFVDACHAGKDIYCEKPLSLTVNEGRRMVQVADETGRVVQVGLQRRSSEFLKDAAAFVGSGGIGQVTMARSYHQVNDGRSESVRDRLRIRPATRCGRNGWAQHQGCPMTRTACTTVSAGSTITPAAK